MYLCSKIKAKPHSLSPFALLQTIPQLARCALSTAPPPRPLVTTVTITSSWGPLKPHATAPLGSQSRVLLLLLSPAVTPSQVYPAHASGSRAPGQAQGRDGAALGTACRKKTWDTAEANPGGDIRAGHQNKPTKGRNNLRALKE